MILLDTSALAKLLVDEKNSPALRRDVVDRISHEVLAISTLAVTELRRVAIRLDIDQRRIEPVLRPFRVLLLTEGILALAGRIPARYLGTLDAIHLATALSAGVSTLVTYDLRLQESAEQEGLTVLSPS